MTTRAGELCKGMRDFYGTDALKREYLFAILRKQFVRFGFAPLETPSMEYLQTLTGKYGDEGDQLIFKILSSGDYLQDYRKAAQAENFPSVLSDMEPKKLLPYIADKALRYDLTIPFARFVAKKYRELPMPFKRYQMQPVWRADRPQKGRYREFYQCDADIIGSDSLLNEADLMYLFDEVFKELNLPVTILVNNRKILAGIAEAIGIYEQLVDMTVALDKLEKIGKENVLNELQEKGIGGRALVVLEEVIGLVGASAETSLVYLETLLTDSEEGKKGLEEMKELMRLLDASPMNARIVFDVTLARGISYYTGTVYEVKSEVGTLKSSIASGGRYDNLTGIFGVDGLSGVGISFGLDRIFDIMEENNLFPETVGKSTDVMLLNFGEREVKEMYPYILGLRSKDLSVEIYPEAAKMKKQMKYANDKGIRFVIFAGEGELNRKCVQLKNMSTGEQVEVELSAIQDLVPSKVL